MEKIGIFYGSSTGNGKLAAELIRKNAGTKSSDIFDIAISKTSDIESYKNLIFGVSTWWGGEIQDDWKDFVWQLQHINLTQKKIALYGLGDQFTYFNNFADGLGILHDILSCKNCNLLGSWPTEGYVFRKSKAVINGRFVGLVLDEDIQFEHTKSRIKDWVNSLKEEFY